MTSGPPSAERAVERRVVVPGGVPALEDYGLIGNLHTAALVSRHGSVDWACFPRFASPSVFGRLLDPHRGGYHAVHPVEFYRSRQAYRPSTALLETTFVLAGGRRLVLTDLMPVVPGLRPEGAPMILREARAEGGSVELEVRFAPRLDYGREVPKLRRVDGGLEARSPSGVVRCSLPWRFDREGEGTARARGTVRAGSSLEIEVVWGARRPVTTRFRTLVDRTARFWGAWTHPRDAPLHQLAHRWHRWVERSELTLKLLSHADTGAFVAAPTTSVPEWPGGVRNWDYRFVWIRDAAFAAQAMLHLGHRGEARAFLRWALLRLREEPTRRLRVVYGAHGETDLAERTLPFLEGLWGSRPVRVGNAAAEQFQLDIYGELLDAALLLERVDPEFLGDHWTDVAGLADQVVQLWRSPDRGIWESRAAPQHYVHSKLMAWVALDRANQLAQRLGGHRATERWTDEATLVRQWILTEGYDPTRTGFRQAEGSPLTDAANLRVPLVGFLPFEDYRVEATVERVRRELAEGPFVYRYRAPDGLRGKEGAFLAASFWLVECLARSGREAEARSSWTELLGAGTPLGLFSEQYDPGRGIRLGNFPQALTHIALLRAAIALGELYLPAGPAGGGPGSPHEPDPHRWREVLPPARTRGRR